MKTLLEIITESIGAADFPRAANLIKSFLKNRLKKETHLYPEPEHFRSGGKTLVGIRYFVGAIESVRFNWLTDSTISASKNLISVDYWDGTRMDGRPSYHMQFDKTQSLSTVLPMVVDFMKAPIIGATLWIEDGALVESAVLSDGDFRFGITEAAKGGNAIHTISNVIRAFGQGLQIKDIYKGGIAQYGPGLDKVVRTIRDCYPKYFAKDGLTITFINRNNKIDANKIAEALGHVSGVAATVSTGTAEQIMASKEVESMEDNIERLAYEEQLEDLRRAMVLLMNNATNSLYLAGRGGVGKTQTVEEELHKRGLTDGQGYFKITGSASTAGIYRLLFEHKRDILLFDDSDGALADQDSRNLFKSASDTKKVRKISWMKAGKNYVDPSEYEEDEDGGVQDVLPRYFDFTGKIIFISNLAINKLDPDGALRTRGYLVNIDPTDAEVYKYMEKIVGKIKLDVDYTLTDAQRKEVITILSARKRPEGSANLRQLVRGLNTMAGILKDGGKDYHNMILRYA
jgi:hypothetical protein